MIDFVEIDLRIKFELMRRKTMNGKIGIAIILIGIVVIIGIVLFNTSIIAFFDGAIHILSSDNKLEITNSYEDDIVKIQLAKTPEKYLMVITLLDAEKAILSGGDDKSTRAYFSESGEVTTEATPEYLKTQNIFIYANRGLIKKPLKVYHFGEIGEVAEYETMKLAREALKDSK